MRLGVRIDPLYVCATGLSRFKSARIHALATGADQDTVVRKSSLNGTAITTSDWSPVAAFGLFFLHLTINSRSSGSSNCKRRQSSDAERRTEMEAAAVHADCDASYYYARRPTPLPRCRPPRTLATYVSLCYLRQYRPPLPARAPTADRSVGLGRGFSGGPAEQPRLHSHQAGRD